MAVTREEVAELFAATFNRAPLSEGLDYWTSSDFTIEMVANSFFDQAEAQAIYTNDGDPISSEEFVIRIFDNLFNRLPAVAGLEYWTNALDSDAVSQGEMILAVKNGATGDDALILANKTEVGLYHADQGATGTDFSLANIDATDASVASAMAAVDATITERLTLTQRADKSTGTDGDDVFVAPVTQNEIGSGELANTFETGDVLSGGQGADVLRADLIATGTIQDNFNGAAISATTTGIEAVYLTAITPQIDTANNTTWASTIDAGRMADVEQWWTDESRADVQIEDIRTRPQDTVFGMELTDPNVSYSAFFNPLFLDGDMSAESALTLIVQEITDGQAPSVTELENITVREINFSLGGTDYTLDTEDIRAANTWADLETAIAAELVEQGLATLSVSHTGNGVFEINDSEGTAFAVEDGEALILGVASDIDTRNRLEVGRLETEGQTSSTLILDGAGSGSQGGAVNIAAASGDRGVEVMDVQVGRDSHISSLASENNPRNVASGFEMEQMLEEVNVTHTDAGTGTLQIGTRTVDAQGVSTTTDDRLNTDGLTDVRIFDASGFDAALKVGAALTGNAFDKYLADADDTVQFSYLLGDAGSNLNLAVNNVLAGDVDFALEIVGGDGDDRINLSGLADKHQTAVDGELSDNTLEVNTSTGFAATQNGFDVAVAAGTDLNAAETSFDDVSNIDTVVIGANTVNVGAQANVAAAQAAAIAPAANANFADTTHDISAGGFGDVDNFVIATNTTVDYTIGGVAFTTNINGITDTRLINLDATTQTAEVSGKNQTLGAGNSDNNQAFGTIRLSNTTGSELDLALSNTARATGRLTVNALTIDGNTSEVRTLNLDSAGTRQTSNTVAALNGNLVNTFNLEGSQDLRITNLASAANSIAAIAADIDSLDVDASTLEGDLYLGVTGAVVTAIDGAMGTNRTVELIGTEGTADILNIRDGVTTTNATTISEFETIRFGDGGTGIAASPSITVATNFNATNVADVDLYDLIDSTVAISLTNLRATENVQINSVDTNGSTVNGDVTLAAANPTTGSAVNVDFVSDTVAGAVDASFWGVGGNNLNVQDFAAINLDMGGSTVDSYDYNFELNLMANPTSGLVNARTLEITGGAGVGVFQDTLTLGLLDTALTLVDFSNYNGSFTTQGWDSLKGTNATVAVNEFDFIFDVGGDNTVIAIPAAAAPASVDTAEIITVDLTLGGGIVGAGALAAGDSITINFAGGEYVFNNTTGAAIAEASLDEAIVADAGNHPDAFSIVAGAGNALTLTAAIPGDMPAAVITSLQGGVAGVTDAAVTAAVVVATAGDVVGTNVTGFDLVTAASEYITAFDFNTDADAFGTIWQINNFMAFEAGENIDLSNQSIIDLRDLGVDSAADISVQAGDAYLAGLTAAEIAVYDAAQGLGFSAANFVAGNAVVTSNEGLNYTILLTGVDSADLVNENFSGIA
ncbi:DUF4214 domain-containing protein [Desulfobacula toluolica]|uniref:DUF4214 domain-containing protein n=1 Tax=Desulfobacula toluolica (strain DSM 7467 / Tol2) TaxID=651182 RepID=K0NFB3_DESTT|nr:DUF4214 domain-containing protein [Desulfobacula toluolica]CCK79580.1 uncharacterized protein TOL2_C14170 [Desulfobacula toluolica Tol2]